jgi:hypothetical protein
VGLPCIQLDARNWGLRLHSLPICRFPSGESSHQVQGFIFKRGSDLQIKGIVSRDWKDLQMVSFDRF